jgi:hypothetical protein
MNFDAHDPPRVFQVGLGEIIDLKDCGDVRLAPDDQVTFLTESGAEYDVARKDWGFYATPSLNGRLERFGLRGVLVKNRKAQYFVMLVERGKEDLFQHYLDVESLVIVAWLDGSAALENLEQRLRAS